MYYLLLYLFAIELKDYDAAFLYNCWFLFIIIMGPLICKYAPFCQEFSVKSLIRRWPLRPVGLLFFIGIESFDKYSSVSVNTMLRIKMAENVGWSILDLQLYKFYLQFFLPWRVEILQMVTRNFKMATRNISRSPFSELIANVTWSTAQKYWAKYQPNLTQSISGSRGSSSYKWRVTPLSKGR